MKKSFTLVSFLLVCCSVLQAQYTRHLIRLTDKKGTEHSLSGPSTYLSAKAIARRTKQGIPVDSTDLPLSKVYLDSIRSVPNVTIINVSKWLNQVLIQTADANALAKINSFPFVITTEEIAPARKPGDNSEINEKFKEELIPVNQQNLYNSNHRIEGINGTASLNYGFTFDQVHLHEGEYLHDLGFTGQGITIAMLDGGFKSYKTNPAFDSVRLQNRVLGEWDFVDNEASVNEDDVHGANCFSIIAANRPGTIVGSAPHASFWLFRTEAPGEYPVEEQNWLAAAEFADSAGVDIISSSLGYVNFENPVYNHTYPQRDGNTSIVTRAADMAAKKGILVCNSAGNSGNSTTDTKFVNCPGDADSIMTVGATDANGMIASFSSWGPNGNGKIKPNIVSMGQSAVYATAAGNAATGNGTSYSTPNVCGLIACLWQAFPEFTNMQIIDAVQKSSHKYNLPDDRYGYGIPDFKKAWEILEQQRAGVGHLNDGWMNAFPVPVESTLKVLIKAPANGKATIQFTDALGKLVESRTLEAIEGQLYQVEFPGVISLARGVYFVRYDDGKNKQTLRIVKGK